MPSAAVTGKLRHVLRQTIFLTDRTYSVTVTLGILLFILAEVVGGSYPAVVFFLLFPFSLLFKPTAKSLLTYIPSVVGLNFLTALFVLSFVNMFGLPIESSSLLILTFVEFLVLLVLNGKFRLYAPLPYGETPNTKALIVVYLLFGIAFVSRVMSMWHSSVPPLHDPEAHAFWTKMIINQHSINYFYSPGLHIWAALINETLHLPIAKTINLLTNSLSAASVLYFGIGAACLNSRYSRIAISLAFIMLIIPLPADLYFEAGKNAFVVAVAFFGIILPVTYAFFKNPGAISALTLFIVLAGISLLHYPTFAFAAGYVFFAGLFYIVRTQKLNLLKNLRSLLLLMAPVIISLVFTGVFLYVTAGRQQKVDLVHSTAAARAFQSQSASSGAVNIDILHSASVSAHTSLAIHNPLSATNAALKGVITYVAGTAHTRGVLILGALALSTYFAINHFFRIFKNSKDAVFIDTSVAMLLSWTVILLALSILPIKALTTTVETADQIIFVVGAFALAWLLAKASSLNFYFTCVLFLALGAYASHKTYTTYHTASATSFVDSADIQAYQWINTNVPVNTGFVGESHINLARPDIVYATDGSLWLPVFTNDHISTPFDSQKFASVSSQVNYVFLQSLEIPSYTEELKAIDYFTAHGYTYLYIDGTSNADELHAQALIDNRLIKIVYTNPEVKIAKFIPAE